eukprot:TRINITY_DN33_c0_g1_i2.p2 TRINITY_DN33_c0_g1~~TRINITY_DN33_c0_g1_i2.p2  ORF type:complete len:633 (-),score=181.37 TRINITY_DN33_c0_g1_i2:2813-4711(-)
MMCCRAALLVLALAAAAVAAAAAPLHVVVVVLDDLGVQDLHYSAQLFDAPQYGKSPIVSPAIDGLARESVKLTSYYTHPTCTPSRVALLTSRYSHSMGMTFATAGDDVPGVPNTVPLMSEQLKQRGYHTHMVGKWHIGHSKESMMPYNRGFDSFFGLLGWGFDHYKKERDGCVDLWRGNQRITDINETDHATNMFSREAVSIIDSHAKAHKEDPMFMYIGYTAAHDPLEADPEFVEICKDVPNRSRRMFCAMIAQVDAGIKQVVDALKRNEMWEDTIFILTSDNGGMGLVGGFNYPLRGVKSMSFEGGVRAPAFVKAPGWTAGVFDGLMHIVDWMPTVLSLVDAHEPERKIPLPAGIDGVDMTPALAKLGEPSPRESVVPNYDVFQTSAAIRRGCYKLILGRSGNGFLFTEPDKQLLHPEGMKEPLKTVARHLSTLLFDFIAYYIPPPHDQFIKYAMCIQMGSVQDYLTGADMNHMVTQAEEGVDFAPDLTSWMPVLNWEKPNYLQLYDVCHDVSEAHNLAKEQPELVKSLHAELIEHARSHDTTQYACDAMCSAAPEDAACRPWLEEGDDIKDVVRQCETRYFYYQQKLLRQIETGIAIALAAVLLLLVCCCCRCCCCKGKKAVKKAAKQD